MVYSGKSKSCIKYIWYPIREHDIIYTKIIRSIRGKAYQKTCNLAGLHIAQEIKAPGSKVKPGDCRKNPERKTANMKIAVRYYTKTGNTKRLAEAIGKAVGAEALPISTPVTEPVDILFLGNSYYAFSIDPEVREFIKKLDKNKVGKIVNFGSAAMLNSTYKKVKAEADKVGIPMDEKEFHCKGEFKGIHKGKPDESDMKAAAAFARKIVG